MNSSISQLIPKFSYQDKSELLAVIDNARIKEVDNGLLVSDMALEDLVLIGHLAKLALKHLPEDWIDSHENWKKLTSGELKLEKQNL